MGEFDKEQLAGELKEFLNPAARGDLKKIAVNHLIGLSGTDEGIDFICSNNKFLEGIISLTKDTDKQIVETSYNTLINVASRESACLKITNLEKFSDIVLDWLAAVLNPEFEVADSVCKLLSNFTRSESCASKVAEQVLLHKEFGVQKMVDALCKISYNPKASLHYLAPVLQHLSQVQSIRQEIMVPDQYVIQKLLPFVDYKDSIIRRSGVVGILKNCCFDTEYHEWLLGDKVDLLPRLLLPLAGPEEFDDDDMDKLPDALQYLPSDKERESSPAIRKMLLEVIFKLCTRKAGRMYVKSKNTYIIIREYHKWETVQENEPAIMQLIDILISDEPETHLENLDQVQIPDHLKDKFDKEEKEMQKELSNE